MTEMVFTGRTALVTGATSGIGAAIARRIARFGGRVVITGRRQQRLDDMQAELGAGCKAIRLDVTDADALTALPDQLEGFTPDILINNAGLALGLGPADTAELADWQQMIDTNITALTRATRVFLPILKQQPRADIINMGSVAGTYPYPGGHVYAGTKAFVHQFSHALRSDLLGTMVRVTCIEPGMVETEFSNVRFGGDDAKADSVYAGMQPMTGEDIARVICDILALPAHINVNSLELMPIEQAFSPFAVHRNS